ncbi:hypothetical protein [Streptomyces hirsutus]|uniref:hypothetical protein n=1 Tax=Streptomyces hirsutus TaxID=35620 RepID=UPI0033A077F3
MKLDGARVNHEPKTAMPSGAGHSGGDSQRDADGADEAADAAGAGRSTFLRWIRIGEDVVDEKQGDHLDVDSPDPCAALFARVTRARAAAAGRLAGVRVAARATGTE